MASLRGRVGTGTMGKQSSTLTVWSAGFPHVTVLSDLARFLKLMKSFFQIFSGRRKKRKSETVDN